MNNVLFNADFLKENQRIKELCIVAKFLLNSGDLVQYNQVKAMVVSLIIREFGQTPILYPDIIADKMIYDSPLIEKGVNCTSNSNLSSISANLKDSENTTKDNIEKDIITMNDLDWW